MSAPVPTLRIDTSGTAFGTAPTYTDRTSYLMTGSQYPVDVTFGRQDEQSEPQPSTCSFFLSNADGYWTPGAGVGPALWDIGCPVNVRLTANAVTYDRFTGFVDAIEPTWPGGVQSWSVVKVSCTDVSARLGIAKPMRSILQETILADAPLGYWPCDDDEGGTLARGLGSNTTAGSLLRSTGKGNNDRGTFGGPVGSGVLAADPTSSLTLVGTNGGSYNTTGYYLQTSAYASLTAGLTVEAWVRTDGAGSIPLQILFFQRDAANKTQLIVWLYQDATSGDAWVEAAWYNSAGSLGDSIIGLSKSAVVNNGAWHHVVFTLASDGLTGRLYIDGAQTAVETDGTAVTWASGAVQAWGRDFTNFYFLTADLKHLAVYGSVLSAARVLAHYQAGSGPEERSDQRFSRIATYGGITTSGLPTGVATMGPQSTEGAPAVEALKKVARTEGTFVYVTTAGALTFQSRTHRYHRAVELALPSPDIATPGVRRDRQGVANELTVTREGGVPQVVIDSASQTAIGRFDGGSFEVCPSTDEDGWQNATWQVQNRKTTRTRMPDVTVDLYRQTSTTVVAQCLGATIGSKAQVTSLPANAPAATMTLFVEGYTETIGYDRWSMGFYTSPIGLEDSVLVLDNATTGVLDTYRLGF